jgi:histidinol-phosphate aminotransferase
LTDQYEIDVEGVFKMIDKNTKLIFLCSPNNPTGNSFDRENITRILESFEGITIIDEAYIDFSNSPGFLNNLNEYDNLIILHTLSKAWGLAGLRLGMAFAHRGIIRLLNKIKYPYNINESTQKIVLDALNFRNRKDEMTRAIMDQRSLLEDQLNELEIVEHVFPSDANFLLVRFRDASRVYNFLLEHNIIVRNRSKVVLCENSLRITVGTAEENVALISHLKNFN